MNYSIPYLILLICYIFLAIIEYNNKNNHAIYKFIIVICSIIYVFFFGLRGFIGWDWTNYYLRYENTSNLINLSFNTSIPDFGFLIYMSLFKTLYINYYAFVFINVILHIFLLNIFLKRYLPPGYYVFGIIVFLIMGGFVMEVDTMRNIMSILLFLLSIKYIEERKVGKYYILNIVGLLFHFSSIFYFPLYFLLHKKMNRILIAVIFIIGFILFIFQIEYMKPIVLYISGLFGGRIQLTTNNYINSTIYGKSYGLTIGLLERLFSAVLIVLYYSKLINASKHNIIFINAFVCYYFFFFYFAEINIISNRVGMLFLFAYWILWPSIIYVSKIKINRQFILCVMILYSIFKMRGLTRYQLYQYDNQMFGIKTYEERVEIFFEISQDILENRL